MAHDIENNTIVFDVDGAILDWLGGFFWFLENKKGIKPGCRPEDVHDHDLAKVLPISSFEVVGLINDFNSSHYFAALDILKNSLYGMNKLRSELPDWHFAVVTAAGCSPKTVRYRAENIDNVFGDLLDEVFIMPLGETKLDLFRRFPPGRAIVIEDTPKYVGDAKNAGHFAIIVDAPYNRDEYTTLPRIHDWKTDWRKVWSAAKGIETMEEELASA